MLAYPVACCNTVQKFLAERLPHLATELVSLAEATVSLAVVLEERAQSDRLLEIFNDLIEKVIHEVAMVIQCAY